VSLSRGRRPTPKLAAESNLDRQNRLRSATLDLLFDTTEVEFNEALMSDLMEVGRCPVK